LPCIKKQGSGVAAAATVSSGRRNGWQQHLFLGAPELFKGGKNHVPK